MSTRAISDKYSNIKDPLTCLNHYISMAETIQVDATLADLLVPGELLSPLGEQPVAGAIAYPVCSVRDGGAAGGPLQQPLIAGIATSGIGIVKVEPGVAIAAGDELSAAGGAQRAVTVAVAGDFVVGQALDESDGSGTATEPHYARLRLDNYRAV